MARLPAELIAISDAASDGTRPSEWTGHLDKSMCPASTLSELSVPKREAILGDWFKQGDLGFIFGARGLGKTWLGECGAAKEAKRKNGWSLVTTQVDLAA